MPPAGFEPAIPSSERSQTYILERVATGIGTLSAITRDMSGSSTKPQFSPPPSRHLIQLFISLTVQIPNFPHTRYIESRPPFSPLCTGAIDMYNNHNTTENETGQ